MKEKEIMQNKQYDNKNSKSEKNDIVILFDLDGTLIDSTEAILESFKQSFLKLGGLQPRREIIEAQVGYPLADMYRNLGVKEESIENYVSTYKEHYRKIHTEKTVLLPGAQNAVKTAYENGARLGVVTTKTGIYSRELLEHFGLMDYFEVLVGSEDVEKHKPHPEPILKALEKMGADKETAWMIGDTPMDINAAKAAGISSVAVSCGYASIDMLERCAPIIEKCVHDAVKRIFSE